MLDAIVAVLQDEALMKEYEKWTFHNPWLEQDQSKSGTTRMLQLQSPLRDVECPLSLVFTDFPCFFRTHARGRSASIGSIRPSGLVGNGSV